MRLIWFALAFLVILTACAEEANRSGRGHEFVVTGQIINVGKQSIEIRLVDTEEAFGVAVGWMDDPGNKHRIHDNCDCEDRFLGYDRATYGEVYDQQDNRISLRDLYDGLCVRILGSIRKDHDGYNTKPHTERYHFRPVFDRAEIVSCETWE